MIDIIAKQLRTAQKEYKAIPQITKEYKDLSIDDAYKIQKINIEKALENGDVMTGKKIGLTSLAMQESLGVDQPDYGFLLKSMEVQNNVVPPNTVLQPRVEGELAFVLKKGLDGQSTIEDGIEATDYVVPAIEVVGSRIADWKLTIVDTVADNASCGMYLLSDHKINPKEVHLEDIQLTLYKNGEEINSGEGRDVLGHPAKAVVWLAKCLAHYNVTLNAGDVILSGALSAAIPASKGDRFTCDFGAFETVEIIFE